MHSERSSTRDLALLSRHMSPSTGLISQAALNATTPAHRSEGEDSVPISAYLLTLSRYKWRILLFTLLCGLAVLLVSLQITPLYQSVAVIDIDRNGDIEAIGSDSSKSNSLNPEQFIATQLRLVQSDAVLRPVALKHQLPLEQAESWFAPLRENDAEARAMAPAVLKHLKVTHPPQTYLLYIQYRSTNPTLAAQVANDIAQSYIDHTFRIRLESSQTLSGFMERQLEELRDKMERSNAALAAFERELNMIDPEERTSIISSRLLQLNAEFTQAQADRVKREAAFRALSHGSMEAATMSTHGKRLEELQKRQQELLENFSRVKQHYGPNHPAYAAAKAELDQVKDALETTTSSVQRQIALGFEESVQRELLLDKELRSTKAEFDRLNATSFQYRTLKREADADRKIYEELAAKTKQATINAGFPSNAIRIADAARPAYAPVTPNIPLNVLLALAFGFVISVGLALLVDLMDTTVRDPQLVTGVLGSEMLGMLPRVRGRNGQLIPSILAASGDASQALVLRTDKPHQSVLEYHESIRTLHASLMLSEISSRIKTLMVTSAAPAEGKSTVATSIAASHAATGKRVLLIDGDLRRPSIADKLSISRRDGLVDVCLHGVAWRDLLHIVSESPNLHVLVTGTPNRCAINHFAETLMDLLADASAEYDLIVLDSPPVLGFPEPLHMATLVDGVLFVALTGSTERKALQMALNQLKRIGARTLGVVLNGSTRQNQSGYYYHQYRSHYTASGEGKNSGADKAGGREADAIKSFEDRANETFVG